MALTICYFSAVELLGRPKPIEYELANYELETVLSYRIIRNESIFIWLKLVETEVPIAYVLPWSDRTVESLQNSFRDAGVGDAIKIEDQDFIENPNERETIFYVQPQKPRPPKSYDEEEQ